MAHETSYPSITLKTKVKLKSAKALVAVSTHNFQIITFLNVKILLETFQGPLVP